MLESLAVKNYKGFEEAKIDLKPITIFLGENSAGKTSLIQLLLLLFQTAQPSKFREKAPLDLHGHFAKMGPIGHLFRNKDTSQPFEIAIKFSSHSPNYWLSRCLREYVRSILRLTSSLRLAGLSDLIYNRSKLGDSERFTDDSLMETKTFSVFINKLVDVVSKPNAQDYIRRSESININGTCLSKSDFYDPSKRDFIAVHTMLSNLQNAMRENYEYTVSYTISYERKKLVISDIKIMVDNKVLFKLSKKDSDFVFHSDLIDMSEMSSRHIDSIGNHFMHSNSIFLCFEYPYENFNRKDNETTLANYFLKIVQNVLLGLMHEFELNQLNHIGPLRAAPKHYYVLDKDHYLDYIDCSDPETCVEILKSKPETKAFVNEWLYKFNFSIDVSESNEEMINHLIVEQDENMLNIPEVGFGVSQILPILIQCHSAEADSLTMIEQPEIHLHPKMQAELANLFAELVSNKNKKLIIESHSEYMLRRLRRLMAEKKQLTPEEVAIYYFERKDYNQRKDYISVRRLEINETGAFDWPGDFYKTEMEDNLAFLRLQKE
jgi:predicted ATPase